MNHDVIIVGARCAGSPLAMLLARRGHRVLVVDRATFPSDTLSTHLIHPQGAALLARWGLLDRLVATGCPAIDTYVFDFGPFAFTGTPGVEGAPPAYCPRRTVLDKLLVDAAREAGAEVREGFTVDEVLIEQGRVVGVRGHGADGGAVVERARVVVGADGRHSRVAEAVGAARYGEKPALQGGYYSYWADLPMHGRFENYIRSGCGFAAAPTHDGLTMIVGGWPVGRFETTTDDVEGSFAALLDEAPGFAARVRGARRVAKFSGGVTPNFFRAPFGPGWALVGDAGYLKDPITAQGITDAFHDAERCAGALDEVFRGARGFDEAMAACQRARDEQALPMYELTCHIAAMEPPPPEMRELFAAVHGNQRAMDDFVRMNAGVLSPAVFFAPDNVAAIKAGRSTSPPRHTSGPHTPA